MNKDNDIVDVNLDYISETTDAWLVSHGAEDIWLPKRFVDRDASDATVFSMPEWLAVDRGLV